MPAQSCPSRETLLQYSIGMLSNEQSDDLAGHLESCPDCQATITTLEDAEDTLIGRLRTPSGSESCLAEPQFQTALAQAIAGEKGPVPFSPAVPFSLGEYQVLEELGRGGMGRVYKALHTKLDRVVAVKVLSRSRLEDRHAITRFEREMKAVGRLAHPNIVQAHDAREIEGTPVLIMEFVDGLDLAEIVHRIGPLPVAESCELVRRTALALQCAHEHGLVHRDIKPSNIMLSRSGEVKLLDLGLARFYAESSSGEEMTGTGQAMGTADYMAPEQASDSRTVDIRADIYSLGCTLYKLLSGQAPFGGLEYRGTLDKLNAHVHQPAPPISQLIANVPQELSAILDRLLAKDPADRFPTPAEVAEILEQFCTGANLVDIITRALSETCKAATIGRAEADESPLSRPTFGRCPESAMVRADKPETNPAPLPASSRRRWIPIFIALALAFMAAGFALGIIIRIDKDGKESTVSIPEGSDASVTANGDVNVKVPSAGKSAESPPAAPEVPVSHPVVWEVSHYEDCTGNIEAPADAKGGGMYVAFDVPAPIVLQARRMISQAKAKGEMPKEIPVLCGLDDEKGFPHSGNVESTDVSVDPNTGTAKWRAILPNPDGILVSGMYARVRLILGAPYKALLVPETAVKNDQQGTFVYVLNDKNVVLYRRVKSGQSYNDMRAVDEGLKADDRVVAFVSLYYTDFKAGMTVKPLEASPPSSAPRSAIGAAPLPDEKMKPAEGSITFRTAKITRGDITATVSATGTIEPAEVVDVSAQISGRIMSFGDDPRGATDPQYKGKPIDYNSPVREGTVLALIDDALYKSRYEQEQAGYIRAQAELQLARTKYKRAQTQEKAGLPNADQVPKAVVDAAEAAVVQSKAALEQARINLDRTVIKSPVQGVIIARRNNIGQNVAPEPNSPSLFLIAKDLKNMQVWAAVNEADIGRIRDGMTAGFTVDAFPNEKFTGKVIQIRKDAQSLQNVVVYTVVLSFDNSDIKLMPYMTANLKFEIDTRKDVLLVPNSALRWKPSAEMMAKGGPVQIEKLEGLDVTIVRGDKDAVQNTIIALSNLSTALANQKHGIIWVKSQDGKHVRPIEVQSGLTDGRMTEISGPDVKEGMEVVIGHSSQPSPFPRPTANPFSPKASEQPTSLPTIIPAVNPAVESKALRGRWKVVNIDKGDSADLSWAAQWPGMKPQTIDILDFSTELVGVLIFAEGSGQNYYYSIDPNTSPKTIDIFLKEPPLYEKRSICALGLYEINGDRLKICLSRYLSSVKAEQRPKSFAVEPDSGDMLLTLERYRPSEDEQKMLGDWTVAGETTDGKAVAQEELREFTSFSFSNQACHIGCRDLDRGPNDGPKRGSSAESSLFLKGPVILTYLYRLDTSRQPKTIAFVNYEPVMQKKFEFSGIYKFGGDRLQIAFVKDGSPPEKFESTSGSGITLLMLQKAKPKPASEPTIDPLSQPDSTQPSKATAKIEKHDGKPAKSVFLGGWSVTDADLEHLQGLAQLESLNLSNANVTDAGLECLEGASQLQSLNLTFTKVTDAGLEHIKGLTKLQSLSLHGIGVTDAGVERLKTLTNLRELSLYNTAITDAGLEHLKGLTKLQSLDLGANKITGAGLKHISGLTELQSLNLIWTQLTDAGLDYLEGLNKLQSLNLWSTNVTDAGLEHLKGLTQLQSLELGRSKVTDAGLEHLNGLTQLQSLGLAETQVTDEGVKKLQKALPNCKIEGKNARVDPDSREKR